MKVFPQELTDLFFLRGAHIRAIFRRNIILREFAEEYVCFVISSHIEWLKWASIFHKATLAASRKAGIYDHASLDRFITYRGEDLRYYARYCDVRAHMRKRFGGHLIFLKIESLNRTTFPIPRTPSSLDIVSPWNFPDCRAVSQSLCACVRARYTSYVYVHI